jgi:hypothetical protein
MAKCHKERKRGGGKARKRMMRRWKYRKKKVLKVVSQTMRRLNKLPKQMRRGERDTELEGTEK